MDDLTPERLVSLYRTNEKSMFCIILKFWYNIPNKLAETIYQSFLLMEAK